MESNGNNQNATPAKPPITELDLARDIEKLIHRRGASSLTALGALRFVAASHERRLDEAREARFAEMQAAQPGFPVQNIVQGFASPRR